MAEGVEHWKQLAEDRQAELESLQQEWQELTESSSELERTLEAELEAETERATELQVEVDTLKSRLHEATAASGSNSKQVDALQAKVTALEEAQAEWQVERAHLEETVEQAKEAERIATSSVGDLQHKLDKAQEDLALTMDDKEQQVGSVQKELQDVRSQLRDLQEGAHGDQSSALKAELEVLKADLDAKTQSLQKTITELREKEQDAVTQLDVEAAARQASEQASADEIKRLKAQLEEARGISVDTPLSVPQLEERIEVLEDQARDSQLRLKNKDDEIESLHNRLGERMTQLTAAMERAEAAEHARRESVVNSVGGADDADGKLMDLQMRVSDLLLELSAKDDELKELRAKAAMSPVPTGGEDVDALKARIEQLQTDLDLALVSSPGTPPPPPTVDGEADALRAQVQQLQSDLDLALAAAPSRSPTPDAANKDAQIAELEAEVGRLRDEAAEKDDVIEHLEDQAETLSRGASPSTTHIAGQLKATEAELAAAKETIALLESRFTEADAVVGALTMQVTALQETSKGAYEAMEKAAAATTVAALESPSGMTMGQLACAEAGSGSASGHDTTNGFASPALAFTSPADGSKSLPAMASPPPPRLRSPTAMTSPVSRAQVERMLHSLMEQIVAATADIDAAQQKLQRLVARGRAAAEEDAAMDTESFMQALQHDLPALSGRVEEVVGLLQQLQATVHQREATLLKENGRLLARVHENRGNILVYARVRPPTADELKAGNVFEVVDVLSDTNLAFYDSSKRAWRPFALDRVIGPEVGQEGVFREVEHVAVSVVDGYRSCIFAYGITGGGKTFTMQGPDDNPGVNIRILKKIFNLCEARADSHEFTITLSMLEIYNEELRDLLTPDPHHARRLEVRTTGSQAGVTVQIPSLTHVEVSSVDEVMRVYNRGCATRSVAATNVHEHSSRSHCVLTVEVRGIGRSSAHGNVMGKLNLVDLAGSERIKKSLATGDRLVEAKSINKSLSALGDVLEALDSKVSHVPYRNSKLTHLLQDSLSANSRTLMICAVSPTSLTAEETLYSLQFAQRTRNIELGPARKMIYYRNVDDTVTRLRHDLNVAASAQESLEAALKQEKAARAKLEKKHKANSMDSRKHFEDRERMLVDKRRQLKSALDDLNGKYRAEKERRMADHEELLRLREKLKAQSHTSAVHAREAQAMEDRAVKLAAEVERVKEMLMEARSTVAYMRKSEKFMSSRPSEVNAIGASDLLDEPLTPSHGAMTGRMSGSGSGGRHHTSSYERRAAAVHTSSHERKTATTRRPNVRRKAFPASTRVHTGLRKPDSSTPPTGIPRRSDKSPRSTPRAAGTMRGTPRTAPVKGSRIPTASGSVGTPTDRTSTLTPRSGSRTPPVPGIRPGSATSGSNLRVTRSAGRGHRSNLVANKAAAKQRTAWR